MSKVLVVVAGACALVLGVAACGGGADDGENASASGDISADAQAAIDQSFEGWFESPPSDSPAPQPDKNIWFVPIASEVHDFRAPGSLHDAARQIGWDLTECDGQFSPDAQSNCIRQAIADGADGIFTYVVDCVFVRAALQDAKAQGIPVVGGAGLDCIESEKGGSESLFDASLTYTDPSDPERSLTYADWIRDGWGWAQGLAIINGTEGQAKLIDVVQTDAEYARAQDDGVRTALEEFCPGCEIVKTVEFTGAEVGAPLQQKVAQALTQHPEADAILAPGDFALRYILPGVQASGRSEMFVAGGEGKATTMDAIRDGRVHSSTGLDLDSEMWAAVDALNRLFAEEKPEKTPSGAVGFPSGNSVQNVNAENNLPPPGERYQAPVDFRQVYLDAWGLG